MVQCPGTEPHREPPQAQCSNDAGSGDLLEVELCLTNLSITPTNDGCNFVPSMFSELPPAAFIGASCRRRVRRGLEYQ